MRFIILLALISCAHKIPLQDKEDDLVHISTVMNQVQASYLKGCVDAYKDMGKSGSFVKCTDRSREHRKEIQSILDQDIH